MNCVMPVNISHSISALDFGNLHLSSRDILFLFCAGTSRQEPHGIHAKKVLFLNRRLPLRSSNQRMITRITTELMPVGMGSLRGMRMSTLPC